MLCCVVLCSQTNCIAYADLYPPTPPHPQTSRPVIASLKVFAGCEADIVLATLVDPDPNAAPALSQVSASVEARARVDQQESMWDGSDNRDSMAAKQTVRVVSCVHRRWLVSLRGGVMHFPRILECPLSPCVLAV